MTIDQLVEKVYLRMQEKDLSLIKGKMAIQVNLTGRVGGVFYIEILDGVLSVMPYEYIDHDAVLSLTMTNFEKILAGKLNPKLAFATGKLKIEGNLEKVLEFAALFK